jgi:hypothetical protein
MGFPGIAFWTITSPEPIQSKKELRKSLKCEVLDSCIKEAFLSAL